MIDAPTLTIICASVSGLAVNVLQYFRESRQHRWAQEQSDLARRERETVARELKQKVDSSAAAVAATAKAGVNTLAAKIDENTEISKKAFREANDVNLKIIAIGEVRQQPLPVESHTRREEDPR